MSRSRSTTSHDCGRLQGMAAAGNVVAQDVLERARLRLVLADEEARQDERNHVLRDAADRLRKSASGMSDRRAARIILLAWTKRPLSGDALLGISQTEIAWLTEVVVVLRDLEPEALTERHVRSIVRSHWKKSRGALSNVGAVEGGHGHATDHTVSERTRGA